MNNTEVDLDLDIDRQVVRRLVERLQPGLAQLAQAIAGAYRAEIEEYARVSRADDPELVASAAVNLRVLLDDLLSDDERFQGQEFEGFGASRMRMGISIGALMRAFNIWGQQTWTAFQRQVVGGDPVELAACLFIGQRIFKHVERASASTAAGFMREAMSTWSDREITHNAMLEALLTGRVDTDEVAALRHGPAALAVSYVAVVGSKRSASAEQTVRLEQYVRRTYDLVGHLAPGPRPLVGVRHSALYMLWPVGDRRTSTLPAVLPLLAAAFPELAFGVGQQHRDLAGVSVSFQEAHEASTIARALGDSAPVHHDAVQLERIVNGSAPLQQLARESLQPLIVYDAKKDAQLMKTLQVYLDSGGSVTEAAQATQVHPNTVIYRLRRIREISGHDPHSPRGRLTLTLSMLSYRLDHADDRDGLSPAAGGAAAR